MSDHDTPTDRASINQLSVEELDTMLEGIRARRLQRVKQLEAIAQVKADDARLISYMKFEKAYNTAKRHLLKLQEMEAKSEELVRKVRLAVMVINMEVSEEEPTDADC